MAKLIILTAFFGMCFAVPLHAQAVPTYSLQTYIIDPNPGIDLLEIAVGYFTSATFPSVVVGFATDAGGTGGLYLYTSTTNTLAGPWQRSAISPSGYYYEHAQTFLYPGDAYPGVIASHDGEVTWYTNPANQGHDPTTYPWGQITVASGYWCHDLDVADLYPALGLPAVACSASLERDTPSFEAIPSDNVDWQTAQPYSIGDGIGLVSVNGGPRINVAGATPSGLNWYLNPAIGGGNPLTDAWNQYSVDGGNPAANINTTSVGVVPDYSGDDDAIVVASSEETWTPGLEWWGPNVDPTQSWNVHSVDSTYRAVHEIDGGVYEGVPYFIAGEQEQAGGTSKIAALHPGIPSRVEMFAYNGSAFVPALALALSTQGTHNQVTIPFQDSLLTVGANHQLYGGYPPLQAWLITASSTSETDLSIKLRPDTLDFGKHRIQKPYTKSITVKAIYLGHGKAPKGSALNGLALSISNQTGTAFSLGKTTCSADLLAGKSCKQKIIFDPSASGDYQGTLNIAAADASDSASIDLKGVLTAPSAALFDY